jgi:hypothetical protein
VAGARDSAQISKAIPKIQSWARNMQRLSLPSQKSNSSNQRPDLFTTPPIWSKHRSAPRDHLLLPRILLPFDGTHAIHAGSCGEGKVLGVEVVSCKEGRHVSSIRPLLNKKTRTPPVKLLIIRPYDCPVWERFRLHKHLTS